MINLPSTSKQHKTANSSHDHHISFNGKYKNEVDKIIHIGDINGNKKSTITNIIKKHEIKRERREISTFYDNKCNEE